MYTYSYLLVYMCIMKYILVVYSYTYVHNKLTSSKHQDDDDDDDYCIFVLLKVYLFYLFTYLFLLGTT